MESRTSPPSKSSLDELPEDDTLGRAASLDGGASRTSDRIARALQVPRATLYELPDAADPAQDLEDNATTVAALE